MEMSEGVNEMLYNSLRLLRNPRKFSIFKILVDKEELTSLDVEQLLAVINRKERLGYIDDTLRELETLKLVEHKGQSTPKTREGRQGIHKRSGFKTEYKCYSTTPLAQMINRFLRAYKSDKPWIEMQPDPKDIINLLQEVKKEEVKTLIEKFSAIYYMASLLFGIGSQPDKTVETSSLYHYLDGKLEPENINSILKTFPNLVKTHAEPYTRIDTAKIILSKISRGRIFPAWRKPTKASYSLTADGEKIVKTLLRQGITPEDLGMELEYEERLYTRKELAKEIVQTTMVGTFFALLGIFLLLSANAVLTFFGLVFLLALYFLCKDFYHYVKAFRRKRN